MTLAVPRARVWLWSPGLHARCPDLSGGVQLRAPQRGAPSPFTSTPLTGPCCRGPLGSCVFLISSSCRAVGLPVAPPLVPSALPPLTLCSGSWRRACDGWCPPAPGVGVQGLPWWAPARLSLFPSFTDRSGGGGQLWRPDLKAGGPRAVCHLAKLGQLHGWQGLPSLTWADPWAHKVGRGSPRPSCQALASGGLRSPMGRAMEGPG